MSRPEADPPGETPEDQVTRFLDGLHDHFARYRPQGSATWNFEAAFQRLEEAWGRTFAADRARALGADDVPPTTADAAPGSLSKRVAGRLGMGRGEASAPNGVGFDRAEEGFDATLEALRFMAARVERLECDAARRRRPLDGLQWFEPEDVTPLLVEPILEALRYRPLGGAVFHAESGGGELLARLRDADIEARGSDPRGGVALEATTDRGVDVELGEAADTLAALDAGRQGAVVLSGVVDREPLPQLLALLDERGRVLAPGGLLVVVSRGPASVGGWAAVARDLLPGRPLHAETWELLLQRGGYDEVSTLVPGGPADPDGAFAVTARKAR